MDKAIDILICIFIVAVMFVVAGMVIMSVTGIFSGYALMCVAGGVMSAIVITFMLVFLVLIKGVMK